MIYIKLTEEDLKQKIGEEFHILKEEVDDNLFKASMDFIKQSGSKVWKTEEYPQIPDGMMALLIPRIYYNINVERFTWTFLGAVVDLLWTKGVATIALASFGVIGRCCGQLHKEKGEVCVYKVLLPYYDKSRTINQIWTSLSRKDCIFKDIGCEHTNRLGKCAISREMIRENLISMKDISAVESVGAKWVVKL